MNSDLRRIAGGNPVSTFQFLDRRIGILKEGARHGQMEEVWHNSVHVDQLIGF